MKGLIIVKYLLGLSVYVNCAAEITQINGTKLEKRLEFFDERLEDFVFPEDTDTEDTHLESRPDLNPAVGFNEIFQGIKELIHGNESVLVSHETLPMKSSTQLFTTTAVSSSTTKSPTSTTELSSTTEGRTTRLASTASQLPSTTIQLPSTTRFASTTTKLPSTTIQMPSTSTQPLSTTMKSYRISATTMRSTTTNASQKFSTTVGPSTTNASTTESHGKFFDFNSVFKERSENVGGGIFPDDEDAADFTIRPITKNATLTTEEDLKAAQSSSSSIQLNALSFIIIALVFCH